MNNFTQKKLSRLAGFSSTVRICQWGRNPLSGYFTSLQLSASADRKAARTPPPAHTAGRCSTF